jgi:TfoX/Sxy family transcriptional regulator of competence genes
MGYDQPTAERVRRILSGRPDIVEKKMVGGWSFSLNGNMCCGVSGSSLMVRVGRHAREWALAQPHVRPMEFAGRSLAAFVLVDPEGFRTDVELATWIEQCVDFVSALQTNEPGARRRRPGPPSCRSQLPKQ